MVDISASLSAVARAVTVVDGKPTTTSLDIARRFGKRHTNVLQLIRNLLDQLPKGYALNFELIQIDTNLSLGRTRKDPAYRITRDGFTLLAMGFTGKRALQFKLAYIDAFNQMEAQLMHQSANPALSASSPAPAPSRNLHQTARDMSTFALAVGLQVQVKVLDMMAEGKTQAQVDESLQHHRWMVYFDHTGKAFAKEIPQDAQVMTQDALSKLMADVAVSAWHKVLGDIRKPLAN